MNLLLLMLIGGIQLARRGILGLWLLVDVTVKVDKITALNQRRSIYFMHRVGSREYLAPLHLLLTNLLHLDILSLKLI